MGEKEKIYTREILVGATEDSIVTVKVAMGDDRNRPNNQYLSFTGEEYSRDFFTEEEGEKQAREILEEGELWRMEVQAEHTTQSLDDWVEAVLNMDGWESVLGDVHGVRNLHGHEDLYTTNISGGQIDMHVKPEDFTELEILAGDVELIWTWWKTLHLKKLSVIGEANLEPIRALFNKYPKFDHDQLAKYGRES